MSAFVCLLGLALLIWCDTMNDDTSTGKKKNLCCIILSTLHYCLILIIILANHSWIGDITCVRFYNNFTSPTHLNIYDLENSYLVQHYMQSVM